MSMTKLSTSCGVCAEEKAGKHYGGMCCRGCKGFFRRSVRLQRKYVCAYQNECVIEKTYRNCCRACRFRSCLDIGLDPRLVHSDRACDEDAPFRNRKKSETPEKVPDSTTFDSPQSTSLVCLKEKYEPIEDFDDFLPDLERECQTLINSSKKLLMSNDGSLGSMHLIKVFDRKDIRSIIRYYMSVDKLIDSYYEHDYNHIVNSSQSKHYCSIEQKLEVALYYEPRKMSHRSKILWEPLFWFTVEGFKGMWCRVALHYVDWATHIPELALLDYEDQFRMIYERSVPAIWLIIAHRSLRHSKGKNVLMSGGSYVPLGNEEEEKHFESHPALKLILEAGRWMWDTFLEPAKALDITDAEFVLLRVLCFFTQVPHISAKSRKVIQDMQNFYRNALLETVHRTVTNPLEASTRVCALLSLLPPAEHFTAIEEKHMTYITMFNIAEMSGSLMYEFYVRRH